jgi:hypothetical protein
LARNTSKLYIKIPNLENDDQINSHSHSHRHLLQISKFKPIPIPNDQNAFLIKINDSSKLEEFANQIISEHPNWIVQIRNDQFSNNFFGVAESTQRQSGLFQLRIPGSGILPVSPSTLAKINSYCPCLQYSVTPLETVPIPTPHNFMSRLFEDWHESGLIESFHDPLEARAAASRLNPSLGEWDGDVFIGRLDNQKVTINSILQYFSQYGQITFLRLCNRSIIREDRGNSICFVLFCFRFVLL